MLKFVMLSLLYLVLTVSSAFATDEESVVDKVADSGFSIQLTTQRVAGIGKSSAVQAYVESPAICKSGEDEFAFFGFGYSTWDKSRFHELQIGTAWKHGKLQLGLGIGKARYDGMNHVVVNPWAVYSGEKVEAFGTMEQYTREPDKGARRFFKGYAQYKVSENVAVGAYGETGVGLGPRVSYKVTEGLSIWGSVPVVHRVQGAKVVFGLVFEKQF